MIRISIKQIPGIWKKKPHRVSNFDTLMRRLGDYYIDELKNRTPPPAVSGFTGELATGKLKNAFSRTEPTRDGNDVVIRFNRSSGVRQYWRVHAKGKIIRSKSKNKPMIFYWRGERIVTHKVKIRRKPYISDSNKAFRAYFRKTVYKGTRDMITIVMKPDFNVIT